MKRPPPSRALLLTTCALSILAGAGCSGPGASDDAGLRGPEGGTLRFDAAMLSRDSGGAPPRDVGPPRVDAGGPVDGFPDVPRTHVGHPDWNGLTLLVHNVVQDRETTFEQVFAVVRNDDPSLTLCSIVMRIEFFDAAGTSITWRNLTFDGDPRRVFSVDADCIPPGATGLGYGNASWLFDVERVARIEYSFSGSGGTGSDVRTIAVVANEDRTIVDPYGGGLFWAVRGRWRVLSGSLRSPDVTVFPLDARGLPYDDLGQIDLIDLHAGATWSYTTTASESMFTDYLFAHSYRGTSSPLVVDTPEARAAFEARERHAALRRERDDRRRALR